MITLENRIIAVAVVLAFEIFSASSVSAAVSGDVIWEADANVFFKYADQGNSSFGKNDHPVELKTEDIATILKSLRIRGKDDPASKRELGSVFSAEQADMLGRYLAKGLRNARPDQDIIFAMERSVSRPLFLKPSRFFVAGRAFYQDSKLNVIIGDYDRLRNDAYEAAYDPTRVGILHYNFDHGRRSKGSNQFRKAVVNIKGVENKQLNGIERNDWLVIDMRAATEAHDQMARIRKDEETARRRKELIEILGSDEASRLSQPVAPATPSGVPAAGSSPAAHSTTLGRITWKELEEGLETLNRLLKKGLITDDDYQAKKQQMLNAVGPN